MEEKKKRFPWKQITVLTVCLVLASGLLWFNSAPETRLYRQEPISAEQVDQLLPAVLGYRGMFTEICLPDEAMEAIPALPGDAYLPVYQQTFIPPSPDRVEALVEEITPVFSQMYDTEIQKPTIQQEEFYSGETYYSADLTVGDNTLSVVNISGHLRASWRSNDRSPLKINGAAVSVWPVRSDDEIMASLSDTVEYLEQAFGMDLSAYRIDRSYSRSDGECTGITVYLYSPGAEIDKILEQYQGDPEYYCGGDYFCLFFSRPDQNSESFVLESIWYYKSQKTQYEVYGKFSKRSLFDAELLLHRGYRFLYRYCPGCTANGETPDFFGYDRVSIEYVFGDEDGSFGFPFYVFYKRTETDGVIEYIKTMVPAVAVAGLDDFFKAQREYDGPHFPS